MNHKCMSCNELLDGNGDCTTPHCMFNPNTENEVYDADQEDTSHFDGSLGGLTDEELDDLPNHERDPDDLDGEGDDEGESEQNDDTHDDEKHDENDKGDGDFNLNDKDEVEDDEEEWPEDGPEDLPDSHKDDEGDQEQEQEVELEISGEDNLPDEKPEAEGEGEDDSDAQDELDEHLDQNKQNDEGKMPEPEQKEGSDQLDEDGEGEPDDDAKDPDGDEQGKEPEDEGDEDFPDDEGDDDDGSMEDDDEQDEKEREQKHDDSDRIENEDDPDLPPRPNGCDGNCKEGDPEDEDSDPCPHCTAKRFKEAERLKLGQMGEDLTKGQNDRFDNLVRRLAPKVEKTFGKTAEDFYLGSKMPGQFPGEDVSQTITIESRGVTYWVTVSAARSINYDDNGEKK